MYILLLLLVRSEEGELETKSIKTWAREFGWLRRVVFEKSINKIQIGEEKEEVLVEEIVVSNEEAFLSLSLFVG